MNRRTANVRAHGFTTLYVLFKEDLVKALGIERFRKQLTFSFKFFILVDYPADKALLARKAQKAAKEVAAKQAGNVTAVSKASKVLIAF